MVRYNTTPCAKLLTVQRSTCQKTGKFRRSSCTWTDILIDRLLKRWRRIRVYRCPSHHHEPGPKKVREGVGFKSGVTFGIGRVGLGRSRGSSTRTLWDGMESWDGTVVSRRSGDWAVAVCHWGMKRRLTSGRNPEIPKRRVGVGPCGTQKLISPCAARSEPPYCVSI